MFTWKPHPTVLDPRTNIAKIDEKNAKNFVMLSSAGETVYVQDGRCYFGDMDSPCSEDRLPGWFWPSYRQLTPSARAAVGLRLPEDAAKSLSDLPSDFLDTFKSLPEHLKRQLASSAPVEVPLEAPRMPQDESSWVPVSAPSPPPEKAKVTIWDCPECGDTISLRVKGVHIAAHRREQINERKRAEKALIHG